MGMGPVANYVCIFFSARSDIECVESYPASNDQAAISQADTSIAKREPRFGYQLWQGSRKIADTRPAPKPVPPQFQNQSFQQG